MGEVTFTIPGNTVGGPTVGMLAFGAWGAGNLTLGAKLCRSFAPHKAWVKKVRENQDSSPDPFILDLVKAYLRSSTVAGRGAKLSGGGITPPSGFGALRRAGETQHGPARGLCPCQLMNKWGIQDRRRTLFREALPGPLVGIPPFFELPELRSFPESSGKRGGLFPEFPSPLLLVQKNSYLYCGTWLSIS